MLAEANVELRAIELKDTFLPEVLPVLRDLYMEEKNWEPLLGVVKALTMQRPKEHRWWIDWAYALRELNQVEEAKAVLLKAERTHGFVCAILHYNLASYCCLLGEQVEAKERLSRACMMDPSWKQAALGDEDLKTLWDDIASMK
ncbi:MAG: hypothetical protein EXS32_01005 [Opitutus sp.]|nr:hypothetical protein [Opitutus sp.]